MPRDLSLKALLLLLVFAVARASFEGHWEADPAASSYGSSLIKVSLPRLPRRSVRGRAPAAADTSLSKADASNSSALAPASGDDAHSSSIKEEANSHASSIESASSNSVASSKPSNVRTRKGKRKGKGAKAKRTSNAAAEPPLPAEGKAAVGAPSPGPVVSLPLADLTVSAAPQSETNISSTTESATTPAGADAGKESRSGSEGSAGPEASSTAAFTKTSTDKGPTKSGSPADTEDAESGEKIAESAGKDSEPAKGALAEASSAGAKEQGRPADGDGTSSDAGGSEEPAEETDEKARKEGIAEEVKGTGKTGTNEDSTKGDETGEASKEAEKAESSSYKPEKDLPAKTDAEVSKELGTDSEKLILEPESKGSSSKDPRIGEAEKEAESKGKKKGREKETKTGSNEASGKEKDTADKEISGGETDKGQKETSADSSDQKEGVGQYADTEGAAEAEGSKTKSKVESTGEKEAPEIQGAGKTKPAEQDEETVGQYDDTDEGAGEKKPEEVAAEEATDEAAELKTRKKKKPSADQEAEAAEPGAGGGTPDHYEERLSAAADSKTGGATESKVSSPGGVDQYADQAEPGGNAAGEPGEKTTKGLGNADYRDDRAEPGLTQPKTSEDTGLDTKATRTLPNPGDLPAKPTISPGQQLDIGLGTSASTSGTEGPADTEAGAMDQEFPDAGTGLPGTGLPRGTTAPGASSGRTSDSGPPEDASQAAEKHSEFKDPRQGQGIPAAGGGQNEPAYTEDMGGGVVTPREEASRATETGTLQPGITQPQPGASQAGTMEEEEFSGPKIAFFEPIVAPLLWFVYLFLTPEQARFLGIGLVGGLMVAASITACCCFCRFCGEKRRRHGGGGPKYQEVGTGEVDMSQSFGQRPGGKGSKGGGDNWGNWDREEEDEEQGWNRQPQGAAPPPPPRSHSSGPQGGRHGVPPSGTHGGRQGVPPVSPAASGEGYGSDQGAPIRGMRRPPGAGPQPSGGAGKKKGGGKLVVSKVSRGMVEDSGWDV